MCRACVKQTEARTTAAWPTKVTMTVSDDAGAAEAHVASAWVTRGKSNPVGLLFWEEAYSLEYATMCALSGDLATPI